MFVMKLGFSWSIKNIAQTVFDFSTNDSIGVGFKDYDDFTNFGNFNGKNSCKYSNKQNKLLKCKKRGKKLKKMVIIV